MQLSAIRREALLPNKGRPGNNVGHPLPLLSNWGNLYERGTYQVDNYLKQGWYWMPVIGLEPWHSKDNYDLTWYQPLFSFCARTKLPVSFSFTQIHDRSYSDPVFSTRPDETNPCTLMVDGTYRRRDNTQAEGVWLGLDGNGNDRGYNTKYGMSLWPPDPTVYDQIGEEFVTLDPALNWMQSHWPNPERVVFLNNNEAAIYSWSEHTQIEYTSDYSDKRFVDLYGNSFSSNFDDRDTILQHEAAALENVIGRMNDAFTGALVSGWRHGLHVGYNAITFGESYGRWHGWTAYEKALSTQFTNDSKVWDGGSSPNGYNNWPGWYFHFHVMSAPTATLGGAQVYELACEDNPDFWHEWSFWDGGREKHHGRNGTPEVEDFDDPDGYPYTTIDPNNGRDQYGDDLRLTSEKYFGQVRLMLWIQRPRVARMFFGWAQPIEDMALWTFNEVITTIWETPLLVRFWRTAEVVFNTEQSHPYKENLFPPGYAKIDESKRWAKLSCSTDPLFTTLGDIVPVWACALVLGTAPNREWLLITAPTVTALTGVTITIPNYQNITLDLTLGGQYWHMVEGRTPMEIS